MLLHWKNIICLLHHLTLTSAIHETQTSSDPRVKSNFSLKCPGKFSPAFGELGISARLLQSVFAAVESVISGGAGVEAVHGRDSSSLR